MSKYVKELEMDFLRNRLDGVEDVLLLDLQKLDGVTANKMRLDFRKKEIHLQTVSNSLAKRVFSDLGIKGADPLLAGPTSVCWGKEDIVKLAREVFDYAKGLDDVAIKGGAVAGTTLDTKGVEDLSKSPSREELLGQLVSQLFSPVHDVINQASAMGGQIASQIDQIAEGKTGEDAEG